MIKGQLVLNTNQCRTKTKNKNEQNRSLNLSYTEKPKKPALAGFESHLVWLRWAGREGRGIFRCCPENEVLQWGRLNIPDPSKGTATRSTEGRPRLYLELFMREQSAL